MNFFDLNEFWLSGNRVKNRPVQVCVEVAYSRRGPSWAQLISPENTAMSWSLLTLSLQQGARSLPPAIELCRCLCVCVHASACILPICVHACMHKYAHECLTALWSMLSGGMMSCELLAMVKICITRKRAWQGVWDSGGETPQWPLRWLVCTFIFYKPHDSPPLSSPLPLSYMNTHHISLNPETITVSTHSAWRTFACTCMHTLYFLWLRH